MEATLSTSTQDYDQQALVGISKKHNPGLYRFAYRMLGDQDLAEDCVAETFSRFLGVVRRGSSPQGNVQAYLYRIAHNWVVDHFRRATPSEVLDDDNDD